jgi:phospholipid/cholesterol/gamma-HCH transport system substrate-binding protein
MESEARYAWVGAMLIALFLALAASIYWLSGASEKLPTKHYLVYFQKQSLEGLQIGSEVRMRGIKVGRVADYGILADTTRGVRVMLEVDARVPVLEGAQATVNRKLVTGIAGVDLANPRADAAPLDRLPPGENYPVIAEGVPEITRVTGVLEDLGEHGNEALHRINTLLSDANQRALASALANTRVFTDELAATAPVLRQTLEQTRRGAERLEQVGVAAQTTLADAGRQFDTLAGESRATLADARVAMRGAQATLEQSRAEVAAVGLRLRLSADILSQDWMVTSKVLRDTGRAVQQTSNALSEPTTLIYGPPPESLGPGEGAK